MLSVSTTRSRGRPAAAKWRRSTSPAGQAMMGTSIIGIDAAVAGTFMAVPPGRRPRRALGPDDGWHRRWGAPGASDQEGRAAGPTALADERPAGRRRSADLAADQRDGDHRGGGEAEQEGARTVEEPEWVAAGGLHRGDGGGSGMVTTARHGAAMRGSGRGPGGEGTGAQPSEQDRRDEGGGGEERTPPGHHPTLLRAGVRPIRRWRCDGRPAPAGGGCGAARARTTRPRCRTSRRWRGRTPGS